MNSFCISKKLSVEEIRQIFSKVLGVAGDSIGVFSDEAELVGGERFECQIVVRDLPGEFPQWYDIYGDTAQTDLEVASRFSTELGVKALVGDATANPYRWILCTEDAQQAVYVNSAFLDQKEGFMIERQADKRCR